MNIGILGANGFVGRSLCLKYLKENNTVFAIYHKNCSLIPKQCVLVNAETAHKYNFDCFIVSIGGHSSTYDEFLEQYEFLNRIVKECKYKQIIFISSIEVYGKHKDTITLKSCFNNPNNYGLSKIAQEFLIKSLPNYIIIRPTYLYGSGMNENSLLPIWMHKAKRDKEIIVYGDGKRKQDYLHVDDLAELCWLSTISDKNNLTVLAATGVSVSNYEIATEICKNIPDSTIQLFGEDTAESSQYDITDTQKTYNWKPEVVVVNWISDYIGKI